MERPDQPTSASDNPMDPVEELIFTLQTPDAPGTAPLPQLAQPALGGSKVVRRSTKLRIDLLTAAYPPRQLPWGLIFSYIVLILLCVPSYLAYQQYVLATAWADTWELQAQSAERELRSAQTLNRERNSLNNRLAGYDTQLAQVMGPVARRGAVARVLQQSISQVTTSSRLAGATVAGDKLRVTCRAATPKDATDFAAQLERLPVLSGVILRSIQTITSATGTIEMEYVVEAVVRQQ